MNKYTRTLTLLILLLPITTNGESMIGNFLKKLQAPSKDLSSNRPGIKKVGSGGLFIYKLDNGTPSAPSNRRSDGLPYNHEAIAKHKREQADKQISKAEENEKQILYGSDKSPIKNASVIDAWDRANEAQRRLEEHREYMNEIRKSRKSLSDKKSLTK